MGQAGTTPTKTLDPAAGLLQQFLAWIAARPRSYGETMEAWRTSCPRISVWEDALGDGLVQVNGAGAAGQSEVRVVLTLAGQACLTRAGAATASVQTPNGVTRDVHRRRVTRFKSPQQIVGELQDIWKSRS